MFQSEFQHVTWRAWENELFLLVCRRQTTQPTNCECNQTIKHLTIIFLMGDSTVNLKCVMGLQEETHAASHKGLRGSGHKRVKCHVRFCATHMWRVNFAQTKPRMNGFGCESCSHMFDLCTEKRKKDRNHHWRLWEPINYAQKKRDYCITWPH